jgi:2-oxo-3-hexenedioate decarboxylase
MKATPPQNASVDELLACIEWVAPGFEIVQSHAPGWKFTAAMTVADGGLHSRLVVGRPVKVAGIARDAEAFNAVLAACTVRLHKNGQQAEAGQGRNVLGSPLLALLHFLAELRRCPGGPELQAGDVVTTGTWTDAWPVQAGEVWQADFDAPMSSLRVTFD